MESSFKRRRLSPRNGSSAKAYHSRGDDMSLDDDEAFGPAPPMLKSRSHRSSPSPKLFADHIPHALKGSKHGKLSALHPRNVVPTHAVDAVQSPSQTVIASVVQVFVNNADGSQVTELFVPVETSVISLEGFAPITLGSKLSPTSSPDTAGFQDASPTRPAPSPSNAAQTIQVQASSTPSNGATSGAQASSSPLSISVADAQSQAVLSSPPSTPLPSSPSPSPSPSSTGSYFPSTAIETSASPSAQSPAATQTPNGSLPSAFGSGNSTISAKPSSTFSGTSVLDLNTFATSANSTLVTSTRSGSSQTSGASSTSSVSSTSLTGFVASSSTGSATSSQTRSSSSSLSSSSTSSLGPSNTGAIIGGGVGGSGGTESAPSPTASSSAGSGESSAPSTPAVVGGVVGGLAGLAIILILLLFLLRRRRARARQREISHPIPQTLPPTAGTGATTERSSVVPFAAGAFLRRMRPGSGQTAATTDTAPSERGFQNMGGRRLESVLSSRGDGYSDPVPTSGVPPRNYGGTAAGLGLAAGLAQPGPSGTAAHVPSPGPSEDDALSGSSFYRDSHGFYGGHEGEAGPSSASPTSAAPGAGGLSPPGSSNQEIAVTRPSPARTPVINQPGYAPFRQPPGTGRGTPPPGAAGRGTPPPRTLTPQLRQQDDVGRSHPSFDGSRGSRFAEEL